MKRVIVRKKAEKNLSKKGFKRVEDGNHIYYYMEYRGKETGIKTFFSHSRQFRDLHGDIVTKMRRQLGLDSTAQIADLLECPMSKDDYTELLIHKGLIDPAEYD